MKFTDWLERKLGTRKWCVAHHLGSRMRNKYDLAITQRRYRELMREYVESDPSAPAYYRQFLDSVKR